MSTKSIVEAIAVTAELTQTTLNGPALAIMAKDLMAEFDEPTILAALTRCRMELTGRLSPAAIRKFAQESDTRPGGDEAWSIALRGFDEAATIVTNDEIAEAMAVAQPILNAGDKIGARVAFRDAYERIVRTARERGAGRPQWYPSLGYDPHGRSVAIEQAVARGLLSQERAAAFLPAPVSADDAQRGKTIAGLLTGEVTTLPPDPEFRSRIGNVLSILKGEKAA